MLFYSFSFRMYQLYFRRHLPIIAKAINNYEGAMIMVSHMPDFVKQIKFDDDLDLGKI